MSDYTDKFNTPLSKADTEKYNKFVQAQSQISGRDISKDLNNYDMQGYASMNNFQTNSQPHFPDTFKKPNHPTFSDQSMYHGVMDGDTKALGGTWHDNNFEPSNYNLKQTPSDQLQSYFKKVEPNGMLILH